jgi:hypothetical protein
VAVFSLAAGLLAAVIITHRYCTIDTTSVATLLQVLVFRGTEMSRMTQSKMT